jgi:hypothetical protein
MPNATRMSGCGTFSPFSSAVKRVRYQGQSRRFGGKGLMSGAFQTFFIGLKKGFYDPKRAFRAPTWSITPTPETFEMSSSVTLRLPRDCRTTFPILPRAAESLCAK